MYVVGVPHSPPVQNLIQQFFDRTFNATHRTLRVVVGFQAPATSTVTALTAGSDAPWILSGCCVDWPLYLPFLERLDPLLRADNIPETRWGAGQLSAFRSGGSLYALPEDAACDVYLYRQDILDQLGLSYPSPDWTAAEALSLWRSCTGRTSSGAWRYGTGCPFGPGTTEGLPTVVAGFGGRFMDSAGTRCLLDDPGSIAAGRYWLHMVWDRIATWGDGSPNPAIQTGQLVFTTAADPTVLYAVQQLGSSVKWDFIPWPRFPTRRVGKLHDNFYAMAANVPDRAAAWEVLRFIAIEPQWSRFYMKFGLAPPMFASLMQEWYAVLRSTAPILRGKHLEYWGEPTLRGEGIYDYAFFKYQAAQALALLQATWTQVWNRQLSVHQAFRQVAAQINALQKAGATATPPPTAQQQIAAAHRARARLQTMFTP